MMMHGLANVKIDIFTYFYKFDDDLIGKKEAAILQQLFYNKACVRQFLLYYSCKKHGGKSSTQNI